MEKIFTREDLQKNIEGHFVIPEGYTAIGEEVFCETSRAWSNEELESIEIPSSITSIGDGAFFGCSRLTSIEIPDSVTSIGENAFCCCKGLTSIEIPGSVTSIGDEAFSGCSGLTSIEIPNSITSIGYYVFHHCKGVTSIKIPDSVTSIGVGAFRECEGLTSIEIPDSVTRIGDRAFLGCKKLTSIKIPDSVTSIGDEAFYGCKGLTSIEIPDSLTRIGLNSFGDCPIENFSVSTDNQNYTVIDDVLFTKDMRELIQYPSGKKEKTYVIPDGVKKINTYAFYKSELKSIVIPSSVDTIDICAFSCEPHFVYHIGPIQHIKPNLTEIHILNKDIESIKVEFNRQEVENITLYVPIGKGYAYRHHPEFSKFKEVVIERYKPV